MLTVSLTVPVVSGSLLAQTVNSQSSEVDRLRQQAQLRNSPTISQKTTPSQKSQEEFTVDNLLQALEVYRAAKNRLWEEAVLEVLGQVYQEKRDYARAIEYFEQALKPTQELRDRSKELRVLDSLSTVHILLGNAEQQGDYNLTVAHYTKAAQYMEQILTIVQERNDRRNELDIVMQLALNYKRIGDHIASNSYNYKSNPVARSNYARTIELLNQALVIAQKLHDRNNELKILGSLGNMYGDGFIGNNYPEAIKYYDQALAIAQELGDRQSEIRALWFLGESYETLADYAKALRYYEKYLVLVRDLKDQHKQLEALRSLGGVYDRLKNYPKAIDYYQQLLLLSRQYQNRQYELSALHEFGFLYSAVLHDNVKAEDYYRQILKIERELHANERTSAAALGYLLLKNKKFAEAEQILLEGIELIEADINDDETDSSRVTAVSVNENIYSNLQQALVAQGKTSAALEISERGRAFALRKMLAKRLSDASTTVGTATPPQLQQLQQIAKQHHAALVEYSIIEDAANSSYVIGFHEPELYIWVIQPTGEVVFRTVDLKPIWQEQGMDLAHLVLSSRATLGIQDRGSIAIEPLPQTERSDRPNPLRLLHQLLIQPIADVLPANPETPVIFIPHSQLFLVPWAALQDAQGNYLIEHHPILTAPAIQVLAFTQQQRANVQKAQVQGQLIVGNPTMPKVAVKPGAPPEPLPPLPSAEQEAMAIAQLLHGSALIGNRATKVAVLPQLTQARIIHFATHGLYSDVQRSGLPGAIALAPSAQDDGLLTASEILNLKLHAELVVLSACDTGKGYISADGVLGLSRALITAGVPSVMVSLWSVPDAPTAELMIEFYRNWRDRKLDKAQALRQAMITMMKIHPNPRAWAAFILIGESK